MNPIAKATIQKRGNEKMKAFEDMLHGRKPIKSERGSHEKAESPSKERREKKEKSEAEYKKSKK